MWLVSHEIYPSLCPPPPVNCSLLVFPSCFFSPFSTIDSAILSVYLECSLIQGQAGLSPMGPAVSQSHTDRHMFEDAGACPSTERAIERLRKAYQCNLAGELADT